MHNTDSNIDKNRILVLTETDRDIDPMFQAWLDNGLHADLLFAPVKSRLLRAFRRLWLNGVFPGASLWYGTWKHSILDYDMIIIHASELTRTIPKWIRSQQKDMRIIYWYWNPVNERSNPALVDDSETELWSFDSADCAKYGMKQNIQYYYGSPEEIHEVKYDVYFVGHDKGRAEQLSDIKAKLDNLGITYRFDLIEENQPNIPYNEVRENIKNSRAILEVNQSGQSGYTLRALEALFFQKKLITTNESIMRESFYRENNIYIIGHDDYSLKEFMDASMDDTSYLQQEYDIDAWLNRFINNKG